MKHIQFFAMREDILLVLDAVERDGPLQYVRTGNNLSPDFETYFHGADIPHLGVADRETGSICHSYLVARTPVPITVRSMKGTNGAQRYLMDQLMNPDTVTLTPAVMWGDDVILQGVIGTASDSAASQESIRKFSSAVRKTFDKVQRRFIGPQALSLFKAGKRLTIAAQSPPEFDLKLSDTSQKP